MKVVFWAKGPFARQATLDALSAVDGVEVELVETLADCLQRIPTSDLLVLGDAPVDEATQIIAAATAPDSRLRALHFISAGRDGFEAAGLPDSLTVSGPVGAAASTVAEHAMALTLAVGRQMIAIARDTAARVWNRGLVTGLRSLEGQRVLVVGLGHVGREYAQRAKAFGATIIGLQRTPRPAPVADELGTIDEIDRYLPSADVVVLTLALTPETRYLIDARRIDLMRDSAVLINVARGGLVDHDALAAALTEGRLHGAGVDVTDPEPLPSEHPLWGAPNTIISPHFAGGGSSAALGRVGQSAADRARTLQEELDHV